MASNGFISRPGYAISDIVYFILGIVLLIKYRHSKYGRFFGIMSIIIGLTSLFYDVFHTYFAQVADLTAISALAFFILDLDIKRIWHLKKKQLTMIYIALISSYVILTILFKQMFGNLMIAAVIAFILLIEFKFKSVHKKRYWFIGTSLLLIGFTFWWIDAFHLWCSPILLLNGRAVFHYFSGLAIFFLAIFYNQFK